ncbi:MAG: ATP synthase F1 subunit gamma [Elusimicrobiota bacterium]
MATLRDIRRKIGSTKAIQKTTKALKMISEARFIKAQKNIVSAKPYSQKIQELLFNLFKKRGGNIDIEHPFFDYGHQDKQGLLVITSEKGLCGSYNTNILRKMVEVVQSNKNKNFELFVLGKKGKDWLRKLSDSRITISHEYFDIFKSFSAVQSEIIADEILKSFLKNNLYNFSIVYTEFKSLFIQNVVVKQLLPIEKSVIETERDEFDYIYEPAKEKLIDTLLHRYIKSEIYRILLSAYTSELAFRRNAMENATQNAAELIDGLILQLNKVRQQQITKELTEIVSAAEVW